MALLFIPEFNLQAFNTLAVPAIAENYVAVTTKAELDAALTYARSHNLAVMILGGGSNVVLGAYIKGLVIHMRGQGISVVEETEHAIELKVAAGEVWHEFVEYTVAHGYWGLENLSLIPGTVGAAPIQNIGAYGIEVKEVIVELSAINRATGIEVTFSNEGCDFTYRNSIFKQALAGQYVVLFVNFRLSKTPCPRLNYPALAEAVATVREPLTPELISQYVCEIRRSKLPDPTVIPNAGSFFKNPIVDCHIADQLRSQFPTMPIYPASGNKVKLAAGWLIDQAGWRGFDNGIVGVHPKQALVLTNKGRGTAKDILSLADSLVADVQQKFNVTLEMEPDSYGIPE